MVSRQGDWFDESIARYIGQRATPRPDAALTDLRAETQALGGVATMQVGSDQGSLLTALTRLAVATSAVEVGTFTGYSSICIARGLQPGGRLLCCDVSVCSCAAPSRRHRRSSTSRLIDSASSARPAWTSASA